MDLAFYRKLYNVLSEEGGPEKHHHTRSSGGFDTDELIFISKRLKELDRSILRAPILWSEINGLTTRTPPRTTTPTQNRKQRANLLHILRRLIDERKVEVLINNHFERSSTTGELIAFKNPSIISISTTHQFIRTRKPLLSPLRYQ